MHFLKLIAILNKYNISIVKNQSKFIKIPVSINGSFKKHLFLLQFCSPMITDTNFVFSFAYVHKRPSHAKIHLKLVKYFPSGQT